MTILNFNTHPFFDKSQVLQQGGEKMKKEMMEYLSGFRNVVKDEFILGRERSGNSEFIIVALPECEKPIYALWNSKKTAKKYRVKYVENAANTEQYIFEVVKPKGTGGKPLYVMLMPNAINELNKKSISLDAAGMILKLVDCIEWNTGRIYRKRDGKSMTKSMLSAFLNISESKVTSIIKELAELDIMHYNNKKKAYFFNPKFIRKGVAPHEN